MKNEIDCSSDNWAPFSTCLSILSQCNIDTTEIQSALIKQLSDNMEHRNGSYSDNANENAITRRISRESIVYSKSFFDVADLFFEIPSTLIRCKLVNLDFADRHSVKLLCYLLENTDLRFHFETPACMSNPVKDQFGKLRYSLFHRWKNFREFAFDGQQYINDSERCGIHIDYSSKGAINDLVLHNPERLICCQIKQLKFDPLQLSRAISSINLGWFRCAKRLIDEELYESTDITPAQRAHRYYIKGLMLSKRSHNTQQGDLCFNMGKSFLVRDTKSNSPLETGWLENGLALNRALEFKKSGDRSKWDEAFSLLTSVFRYAEMGNMADFSYLRFNALANMSLLFEMIGRHDLALKTILDLFESPSEGQGHDTSPFLQYRIGMLQFKMGTLDEAVKNLKHALRLAVAEYCPLVQTFIAVEITKMEPGGETAEFLERVIEQNSISRVTKALIARTLAGKNNKKPASKLPVLFPEIECGEFIPENTNIRLTKMRRS